MAHDTTGGGVPTWSPTIDHLRMQVALFSGWSVTPRPDRHDVVTILNDLRGREELSAFRIWLVGSRLDGSGEGSDIDVVLSPGVGRTPTPPEIDHALWTARAIGVGGTCVKADIDPTYRATGPARTVVPLLPDAWIDGIQLLSPRRMHESLTGRMSVRRLVGRFSIEFSRRAGETNFFSKLPQRRFAAGVHRYLRPALEITGDLRVSDLPGRR